MIIQKCNSRNKSLSQGATAGKQSAPWRARQSPIAGKRFCSEYHGCQSYSIKFSIVRGFLILHGRKLGIALGEVRA